jgi:catechol 2,3-dioxygenase-like lactoylglutathione lyase family enzyme
MTRLGHAIVFVTDMDRSVAFYRDAIGLKPRFQSPDWTEFETDGTVLALHAGGPPASVPSHDGPTPAGTCQPGFAVDDVDALHARLTRLGVPCLHPPRDEHGIRLANYADPDGLAFSVSGPSGS